MSWSLKETDRLEGHEERVWHVEWSPSGASIASCSGDKTVRIWVQNDMDGSWRCAHVLEGAHYGTVRSCCWSPDEKHLATASFDKRVAIWEYYNGEWENVTMLEGHDSEVKGVGWSCNGSMLATCGRDKTVWFWESQPDNEFDVVDVKHGHSQDVKAVRWHPKGEVLVSVSYDNTIKFWMESEDEWECVKTIGPPVGHESTVWDASFDQSGTYLATCSDDKTVKIWHCKISPGSIDTSLVTTISGSHDRTIYSIDWSPQHQNLASPASQRSSIERNVRSMIATAGGDNLISIMDVRQRASDQSQSETNVHTLECSLVYRTQGHELDVNCVRWRPGTWPPVLASAADDGMIKLWTLTFA